MIGVLLGTGLRLASNGDMDNNAVSNGDIGSIRDIGNIGSMGSTGDTGGTGDIITIGNSGDIGNINITNDINLWQWISDHRYWVIGVCVILLMLIIIAILYLRKKKTEKSLVPPNTEQLLPADENPGIRIGKLHGLGARSSQQDCFSVSPEEIIPTHGLLAIVADGMGGLQDGDKVSQKAVTTMMDGFYNLQGEPELVLLSLLGSANMAVNAMLGPENYGKSGSTLVAGLIKDNRFYYLSVGDSRICLMRDGALYQLNREHVYRDELYIHALNGEGTLLDARNHPRAAGLTSFLGKGRLEYVDIPAEPVEIRSGDVFMLMSDGVYNAVTKEELIRALSNEPQTAVEILQETIKKKNYSNQDNFSAVILRC